MKGPAGSGSQNDAVCIHSRTKLSISRATNLQNKLTKVTNTRRLKTPRLEFFSIWTWTRGTLLRAFLPQTSFSCFHPLIQSPQQLALHHPWNSTPNCQVDRTCLPRTLLATPAFIMDRCYSFIYGVILHVDTDVFPRMCLCVCVCVCSVSVCSTQLQERTKRVEIHGRIVCVFMCVRHEDKWMRMCTCCLYPELSCRVAPEATSTW